MFVWYILDMTATSSSVHRAHLSGLKAIDGVYIPSDSGLEDLTTKHFVEGVKIWDRSESSVQGQWNVCAAVVYDIDKVSESVWAAVAL